MKFARRSRESLEEEPQPELVFVDPFPEDVVNNQALLNSMGITMRSGQYRTSVETVGQAMRPAFARRAVSCVITDVYDKSPEQQVKLRLLDEYLDELVDPEILNRAEEILKRQSPGLRFNEQLLNENNETIENSELTIKQTLDNIAEFVHGSYIESAADEEVRGGLVADFENWVAARPQEAPKSWTQVVKNETFI